MSRNRARNRNKPQLVRDTGGTALADRPVLIPLDEEIRPILEEARGKRAARQANSPLKAFSLAWDETEAMGITADMRRSGPGMLSDADRKDTLYQAYLNSVWISACVDVIAKRITSGGMTIDLAENGKENQAEYDALHEFLHYINEDEDFLHLIRGIVTDLLIYGEAYMEIVSKAGRPFSLHKIDCCTMNYKLDRHGIVTGYVQNMVHSTETVLFEPDEVIRWWLADPKAGKKALSPIERILGSVDADVHMSDWVRAFFRKGARPPFWIKYPGSLEEAKRFVAWLRETYTGQANAHVPMVLYDEAELYEIGKGAVDMDFLKGREYMCKEILAGYQVPPALVGLIESGNIGGGTGESQEKSFLHNACDPIRELVFELFNYRVVKKGFGITNYRVGTRYADFRSDMDIATLNDKKIRNGSSTVNEVRSEAGRVAVDGGDEAVIVASRDIVPVARLSQLADEQAASAQVALDTAKANADMAATKAKQAKEPPAPVPAALQNAQAGPVGVNQPGKPAQANNQQQKEPSGPGAQEHYIRDLHQATSRVNEALARADEHLRLIRAQNVTRDTREGEDGPVPEYDWTRLEEEIRRILTPYSTKFEENEDKPDDEPPEPPTPTQSTESAGQPARTDTQESDGAPEPLSEPVESTASGELRSELAQWRERALEDVETRAWRGFTTTIIPESLHAAISQALQNCVTQADVQFVFESAQQGRLSKVALKHRIHELLSGVAERGHKALGEESEEK